MSERAGSARRSPAIRTAVRVSALGLALALGACAGNAPTPRAESPGDPAMGSHREWCGTNPPSGYCDLDYKN